MQKPTPTNVEHMVKSDAFLVSKTDKKGRISYCNQPFIEIVKLSEQQLLGKPHSIVRHPDMPRSIFKLFWEKIENKEEIFAYVKNLSYDGGFYWVFANVTASLNSQGEIVGYYSVRRKPNPKALEIIIPLYKKLLEIEKSSGMEAATSYIHEILNERKESYEQFSNNLQRL